MFGPNGDNQIIHKFTLEPLGETEIDGTIFTPEELELFVEPKIRKEFTKFLLRKRFNQLNRQIFFLGGLEQNNKTKVKISQKKQSVKKILEILLTLR